jgi:hypothetical protein
MFFAGIIRAPQMHSRAAGDIPHHKKTDLPGSRLKPYPVPEQVRCFLELFNNCVPPDTQG